MNKKLLLVDFENVQQLDLSWIDDSFSIIIFVGASQKNIPFELVTHTQEFGSRIKWQKIEGNGSNALDFFIAFRLGSEVEKTPQLHCFILSKDKGFDPLLHHLNKIGLKCERINSLLESHPKPAIQHQGPSYHQVVAILKKSEKKSRPQKRKTLSRHISSMFQKKILQPEIDHIIDTLFANKMVSEINGVIIYKF